MTRTMKTWMTAETTRTWMAETDCNSQPPLGQTDRTRLEEDTHPWGLKAAHSTSLKDAMPCPVRALSLQNIILSFVLSSIPGQGGGGVPAPFPSFTPIERDS